MEQREQPFERHRKASHRDPIADEVNQLLDELRARRAYWLERLERRQHIAQSLSESLSEPEDEGDRGAAQRESDRMEPMVERAARRVDGIQRALDRAVQGRLTVCDRCEEQIPVERLRAVPETTLCARCARELESAARRSRGQ